MRDALLPYKDGVLESLWNAALDPNLDAARRFQAACALATYAPNDQRWSRLDTFVAGRLVTLEASALVAWREALRPAKGQLIEPLTAIFRDTNQDTLSRRFATETLADYLSGPSRRALQFAGGQSAVSVCGPVQQVGPV